MMSRHLFYIEIYQVMKAEIGIRLWRGLRLEARSPWPGISVVVGARDYEAVGY